MLEIKKITKNFGGLSALYDVTFALKEGQIKGLIGPNGSGKTTLFNVVSGIYLPDEGFIRFDGIDITLKPAFEVCRLGIGRTFQEIQLFYDMTVLENAMVGCHRLSRAGVIGAFLLRKWVRDEEKFIREKARESLTMVGLNNIETELARNISYGHQRLLEIARALAGDPKILLLDEPAAGMNQAETVALMSHIEEIRNMGVTILLVEHNMKMVMDICDQITVLNHGQTITNGTPLEIQANEQVVEAYLGKASR